MNSVLASIPIWRVWLFVFNRGPVAQLGARFHGMEEVVGSIPTAPTNPSSSKHRSSSRTFRRVPRVYLVLSISWDKLQRTKRTRWPLFPAHTST